jgi:ArsR family transcriptional regulator, arsenate/arsenite/antimonite-responsive transcriptional repressor
MTATEPTIEATLSVGCCGGVLQGLSTAEADHLSAAIGLLANPVRLQILDMLGRSTSEVCVCDLEAALPVKQPTVSHHLRLLREAGLIDCERRGHWAYYFVQREAVAALHARITSFLLR